MTSGLPVAILGAGPAGLTAAYALSKKGIPVTVLEADPEYVGGISRTAKYKGYHFDIGGHRFFSKSKEIEDLWTEILPDDMLDRPRSSRIFYNGQFFAYPLKGAEALVKLGPIEAAHCVLSYAKARAFPTPKPTNLEDWVTNEFGSRLYRIFFKTYTEKVWGMPCNEISADWAAQRIKGLSLSGAIKHALVPQRKPKNQADKKGVIKTLIDTFRYPRKGPGMLWEACAEKVKGLGGTVEMGCRAESLDYSADRGSWKIGFTRKDGTTGELEARAVISSAPLREVANALAPKLSAEATKAANALKYRDFITVVLILEDKNLFDDNWIYIHDPNVKVGRIQNFKSWSPEMIPDPKMACYGLEYFCFENDGLWSMKDEDLVKLATKELAKIGLAKESDVTDGCVVRQVKAYPVYDDDYTKNVETVRSEMEQRFPTLYPVGRNGMHKYNNQDHAMMTALLTAENIAAGSRVYDVWEVNQDAEYHEAGKAGAETTIGTSGIRAVPTRVVNRTEGA
ncbi:MAG: NAD(P)/FAD-dependent oxidoreductase [Labilithrix sp.]|nr:NAD(P)/FAD-dependent oxidoreductase [Labilithrix sp.]MCW5810497.1 NAD(P)/FAD-dependent oxidoreductase [Labilithrix sp.]